MARNRYHAFLLPVASPTAPPAICHTDSQSWDLGPQLLLCSHTPRAMLGLTIKRGLPIPLIHIVLYNRNIMCTFVRRSPSLTKATTATVDNGYGPLIRSGEKEIGRLIN